MRELREFRAHHDEYRRAGVEVAGVSLDDAAESRASVERLRLPYPLLADVEREAGNAFGVVRTLGIAGWKIEFYRRSTFLIDERAVVVGIWPRVKVRGHALEVLAAARALPFRATAG